MKQSEELRELLHSIHRKSYPAYKGLKGIYDFRTYRLSIDHVQGDPFASPSSISVRIWRERAGFPDTYLKEDFQRTALADFLTRQFSAAISRFNFRSKGSGKSGLLSTSSCSQEILKRTSLSITEKEFIARFEVGFPANGRTINAPELEKIFFDFLPKAVTQSFFYRNLKAEEVRQVIELSEDQNFIRKELPRLGLIAFVADGSILPRESGISQKPMKGSVPFISPESLRVELTLPHHGKITGLGIRKGITLIVGGGYHGKSTLLSALERGVYNHIAGDGREYVITDPTAVKLRSEDGRLIREVDISLFINDLPNKKDTHRFSTPDASGSTSQAAGIVESMEAESQVFLLDEDTSATNFMVRDSFMQSVIHREKEPITPFLERARDLYEKCGISTVLVAGSSGAFFHIADTVIQMDAYRPMNITEKVKAMLEEYPLKKTDVPDFVMPEFKRELFFKKAGENDRIKTRVRGKDGFQVGKEALDLRYVEQIVDVEQTAALAAMLRYTMEHINGSKRISEIVEMLEKEISNGGLEAVVGGDCVRCGLAMPRKQEIFACFNRYRG